jgi:hypothetical protein
LIKNSGGRTDPEKPDESTKYKSAEFGIIGVDELTEHTVDTFNILIGSLRWAGLKNLASSPEVTQTELVMIG